MGILRKAQHIKNTFCTGDEYGGSTS